MTPINAIILSELLLTKETAAFQLIPVPKTQAGAIQPYENKVLLLFPYTQARFIKMLEVQHLSPCVATWVSDFIITKHLNIYWKLDMF